MIPICISFTLVSFIRRSLAVQLMGMTNDLLTAYSMFNTNKIHMYLHSRVCSFLVTDTQLTQRLPNSQLLIKKTEPWFHTDPLCFGAIPSDVILPYIPSATNLRLRASHNERYYITFIYTLTQRYVPGFPPCLFIVNSILPPI